MSSRPARLQRAPEMRAWAAVEELQALAPDLGWAEATSLADALVDGLAHRCVDLASGVAERSSLPLVVGAVGGQDTPPDHASCRAAAARLRSLAPVLAGSAPSAGGGGGGAPGWATTAACVAEELADLLDQLADRSRRGGLRPSDKGVVLRRLHALQRRLA